MIPKEIHDQLIASYLDIKVLFRVGLACVGMRSRGWYSFEALHTLSSQTPNKLYNSLPDYMERNKNTNYGGKFPNLVEFSDVRTYESAEIPIKILRATTPGKLQKLGFSLQRESMDDYKTMLNLCAPRLRTLSVSGYREWSPTRLLLSIEGGFAQLRHLCLSWSDPAGEILTLPSLPNLEILDVLDYTLERIGGLKDMKKLKYIRCGSSGPLVDIFDAEMWPSPEVLAFPLLVSATAHLKSLLPPSVGLNVVMKFATNTGGMYPGWGSTEETLATLCSTHLATVEHFEHLLAHGAQLDFLPIDIFSSMDRQSPLSVLVSLTRAAAFAPEGSQCIQALDFVLNHPSCTWNIVRDKVVLAALASKNPKIWDLIIGEDGCHLKRSGLWPDLINTSFSIWGNEKCDLLAAYVNEYSVDFAVLRWLAQPHIRHDLFRLNPKKCSVFHSQTGRACYKPEVMKYLRDEWCALPNLRNHDGKTTVEHLLGISCSQPELNRLVECFGAEAFRTDAAAPSSYMRMSHASTLCLSSAFDPKRSIYSYDKATMLAVSNLVTVSEIIEVYLKRMKRADNFETIWQADALLFLLRGGFLKKSAAPETAARNDRGNWINLLALLKNLVSNEAVQQIQEKVEESFC